MAMTKTLDDYIEELMRGRLCSEVTHDALVVLVLDWQFLGHDRHDLLDAIQAAWDTGECVLGDEYVERVEQAKSYTRDDGHAPWDDSSHDL